MLDEKPKRKRTPRRIRAVLLLLILIVGISGAVVYFNMPHPTNRQFTKPKTPITADNVHQIELIGKLHIPYEGRDVQFSDDSRNMMFTVGEGASVWDTSTGEQRQYIQEISLCYYDEKGNCFITDIGYFYGSTISPDGKWVATAISRYEYNETRLWNIETGEMVKSFGGRAAFLKFTADNQFLIYSGAGELCPGVCIYNLVTEENSTLLEYRESSGVAATLTTATGDNLLLYFLDDELWSIGIQTDEKRLLFDGVDSAAIMIIKFEISPDGKWAVIVSRDKDSTVEVWNLQTGQQQYILNTYFEWVTPIFTPDSTHLITYGDGGAMRIWDLQTGEAPVVIDGKGIRYATLSPHASMIVSISDNTIDFWNLQTGKHLYAMSPSYGYRFVFSPDGTMLASENGKLYGIPSN